MVAHIERDGLALGVQQMKRVAARKIDRDRVHTGQRPAQRRLTQRRVLRVQLQKGQRLRVTRGPCRDAAA